MRIIHALRAETPFSHRKRKLAIARGTPASSASFRDMKIFEDAQIMVLHGTSLCFHNW